MVKTIRKAAVIGSGVMGSGIAALLANVGIQTLLLDVVPNELTEAEKKKGLSKDDDEVRNRLAKTSLEQSLKRKPAPLTSKKNIDFITIGNTEDHWNELKTCDWIVEVVVENLQVKKQVLQNIDRVRKKGSIVSSNTSGISVHAMSEECSQDFKEHFLGTHFFNPPRYLKLLEIIPTKETKSAIAQYMKNFGEEVLGKKVVFAKDTPNFIANRIGTYGLLVTVREMNKSQLNVGEVDSLTGPLIGRPKSATFRTLDVVGLDTFAHVAHNVFQHVEGEERELFTIPPFMEAMLEKGLYGSKAGKGFYKKEGKEILQLNTDTLQYEPRQKFLLTDKSKGKKKDMKALLYSSNREDQFLWNIISPVLLYSAHLVSQIADNIIDIDEAMRAGFGWKKGPFELWDELGVEETVTKMKNEEKTVPSWVEEMLESGFTTFYKQTPEALFYFKESEYKVKEREEKRIHLASLEKTNVLQKNSGASLLDMGDDVLCLQFTSPNNAIGLDIIDMIHKGINEAERNYKGLIIGNQGKNFCVGANLAMMLMEAQDDNYEEIDFVISKFQGAMQHIKYSLVPVVTAPFSMTLGGGAEVCLPSAHIQAASETYMGLVEGGVGLIPGGGGSQNLYQKVLSQSGSGTDLLKVASHVFETIAMAKVSTSAREAGELGFLNPQDKITQNEEFLLYDAKQAVIHLSSDYRAPVQQKIPVVGESGYATLLLGAQSMKYSGYISDHDLKIAKKLAFVIAGGRLPFGTKVDEQYLLDLEREAFLSLIGELKSQERMQHMLLKGKPLRN
ncbi:3-hydroxyacyl-CoA dehydrogenase/enoyl-CoA hydratase family protein [Priestia endophytica]|uniref:3-hydroxyacyl-CoA dehydrogenase/enoyl-CoA hydratase family protein n=1 Tax=Priestia endophytica TaxID=135735 RepID=UPI002281E20B|nr:3-hydroxyacyl-CoA dehydrogenase/enoyl-CoA hydratase family protein [Priestia endophytica]MCY8231533.1 3-hydroxyacyl-CoA dehydrogenase/enoyl-CoA hydratase family protein [Priestia endophytica]